MLKGVYWVLLSAIVLLISCHSRTFEVKGETAGIGEGDTLLVTTDLAYGIPSDTLVVHDGKFTFSGRVDSVYQCVVYHAMTGSSAMLFIEPGVIHVRLSDMTDASRVWGTKLNDEWQMVEDTMQAYATHVNRLLSGYDNGSDSISTSLEDELLRLTDGMRQFIYHTAERNITNEVGYFLLIMGDLSDEERLTLVNKLPRQMRKRPAVLDLMNSLWQEEMPEEDIEKPTTDHTT